MPSCHISYLQVLYLLIILNLTLLCCLVCLDPNDEYNVYVVGDVLRDAAWCCVLRLRALRLRDAYCVRCVLLHDVVINIHCMSWIGVLTFAGV